MPQSVVIFNTLLYNVKKVSLITRSENMLSIKEKTSKTVRLVSGTVLGAMTVILGALFIWQTLSIYLSGNGYSREIVAKALGTILPAIIVWLVMAVAAFVLWEVFPAPKQRFKQDRLYTLYRLKKRIPEQVDGELNSSLKVVKREELILLILRIVAAVICLGAAIFGVVYLALPASFPPAEDKTHYVYEMAIRVLPVAVGALLILCGVEVYAYISAKKQLPEVKKIVKDVKPTGHVSDCPKFLSNFYNKVAKRSCDSRFYGGLYKFLNFVIKYKIWLLRAAFGCVFLAFFIAGICNDGMRDMLLKAIKICTECIGLG